MSRQQPADVRTANVKGTNRTVQVYKLKQGNKWNIYLGDKLTMSAIEKKQHTETFTADQLEFI